MPKIDYNLVYAIAENSRMGLKELSKHMRKSPQRLKYSINTLKKEGMIREPYCVFDYSYFGLLLFRVYFRAGYINEQDKGKIIAELRQNPYTTSIYELAGEFELTVEFAAPNPSRFNKELKKLSRLSPKLNDYKVILNLVSYVCPKHYLTKSEHLQELNSDRIIGGDRERESFSSSEMEVMKNLLSSPTIRQTELSRRAKLNVKTAKSIIKSLKRRNVIKGFKAILDRSGLGISSARLFLKLHYLSPASESDLMARLLKTNEVVQINKTVGDWDLEIDIESLDKARVREIIVQIREEFKEIIERFNLMEMYRQHKKSYLPLYLFTEQEPQIS